MTRLLRTFYALDTPHGALLRGFASVFDLRGNTCRQYHLAESAERADREAFEDDWSAVFADLSLAIGSAERRLLGEQQIEAGR